MEECHFREAQGLAVLVCHVPKDCDLSTGWRVKATGNRHGVRGNLRKAVLEESQSRGIDNVRIKSIKRESIHCTISVNSDSQYGHVKSSSFVQTLPQAWHNMRSLLSMSQYRLIMT